ncbi:MAG: autotransporter domain-containing protein [Pseudomonadota bacterium]
MVTQRIMLSCAAAALVAGGASALAQDVDITDDLTTPQSTPSTGSFTISNGGSITVTDLDAVTVDTGSDVTMNGTLIVEGDGDNVAGIRIVGDRVLDVSINGAITLDSSLEVENEVPVDFPDNRFGIVLDAGGSLTGDIFLDSSAALDIEGENGGGVVLQGDLIGSYEQIGGIILQGDGAQGAAFTNVTGDLTFDADSSVNVQGVEADGVTVSGDIGGSFTFGGVTQVTGFTDTVRDVETDNDVDPEDDNNDLQETLVSGNAISLLGDVAGGVLINGQIDLLPTIDADADVTPGQSGDATVTVFGSGNALLIGNETTVSTIGTLTPEEGLAADFGSWSIINRGTLTASGVYDGIATEAVRIQNVTSTAGIRNSGTIIASSFEADSVGARLTGDTNVPELRAEQDISATVTGDGDATALLIDSTVTLPVVINDSTQSTLSARADGGDAVVVRDLSGTVTSFTNSGVLQASQNTDDGDDAGATVALDFSVNTSGISILNTVPDAFDPDEDDSSNVGFIFGDVLTGSGNDSFVSEAGALVGDVVLGDGDDSVQVRNGALFVGDLSVGTGNDTVDFAGFTGDGSVTFGEGNDILRMSDEVTWTGDLDFGAGSDLFEVSGLSTWSGNILNADDLTVSVDDSTVTFTNTDQVTLTGLTVANNSTLGFDLTATGDDTARILAAGTVTIDDTSTIGFSSVEGFSGTIENRLITAGTLNIDLTAVDVDAQADSSFLVEETLVIDPDNANSLLLRRRRREANEVGVAPEQAAAFNPALTAVETDTALSNALYNATTQDDFLDLYGQLTPEPLDLAIVAVRAHNNAMTSILRHRTDREGETLRLGHRQAWIRQEVFYVDRSEGRGSEGFDGYGYLLAIGADRRVPGLDVLGVAASLSSTELEEKLGDDFPVTRTTTALDIYATKSFGRFALDGRIGYGWASSDSERNISFDLLRRDFEASWDGTQLTGNGRLQYFHKVRGFDVIPTVSIDYLSIEEDGYTEDNLDNSVAITAEDRDAESLRLNSGLSLGWTREHRRRNDFTAINAAGPVTAQSRVSLSAGLSQELQGDTLTGTYRFGDGEAFTLEMDQEDSGYYVGGDLTYRNGFMRFSTGFNGSFGEETTIGSAYISVGIDW